MMARSLYRAKLLLETLQESGITEVVLPFSRQRQTLDHLQKQVSHCTQCKELVANRHTVVFGSGNPHAKLVFVGEAPGAEEDRQGLPFVGPAGQLLTKMIEAIQLHREEVFIANVLKCRPPNNRPPKPLEVQNCEPYLAEQIFLIRPKLICALGTFAAQTLLKTNLSISILRGKTHDYRGIPVLCTFHPAYLLRNPAEKRKAWEDLKKLKALLEQLKDD